MGLMRIVQICVFLLLSDFWSCGNRRETLFQTENLILIHERGTVYRHVSFLETESWGKVSCNGAVYLYDGMAYIFDAPVENKAAKELISWIEDSMKHKVAAIFINHFHIDCLGSLKVFHEHGIESYATNKTIELARADSVEVPHIGFEDTLIMNLGGDFIVHRYLGPAHTQDNMVSYIISEKVLFGGCMIKSSGAGKGNLADADTLAWPKTVRLLEEEFDKALLIIPGHGPSGGRELLDYTISLFEGTKKR
jgi:metallo-beta-lactamase class B